MSETWQMSPSSPPPPAADNRAVQKALADQRKRARLNKGAGSTVMTDRRGLPTTDSSALKTVLGHG